VSTFRSIFRGSSSVMRHMKEGSHKYLLGMGAQHFVTKVGPLQMTRSSPFIKCYLVRDRQESV
jgi:hypothetical protein